MPDLDVLIVGGGPAGASCAWALRRAGMKVGVLDQAPFPRDKVCAGWITPAVLDSLEIDAEDYGRGRVIQPIRAFRVGLMGGLVGAVVNSHAVNIRYAETVSYGIRRREFDDYLLRRSGARLFTGEPVHALLHGGKDWLVNAQYRAPMLVGAGGHTCPVARALGAQPGREAALVAQEIEFLLPENARAACQVHGERPELYFCRDLAGYGWCLRKGDYLNIGLGRESRWNLLQHVEKFIAFLQRRRGVPQLPAHLHGHAYLQYGRGKRNLVADGALLIGDAAGLASPQSGEGIRPAVESGLLAAQTIIEARGQYGRQHLQPYLERIQSRFGNETPGSAIMPDWGRKVFARALFSLPGLVRRLVIDKAFLHANQPALAPVQPS